MVIGLLCQPIQASADLPGVDTKDLDEDETKLLTSILDEQFDPCGKTRSFLESIKDPKTCALAPRLANFVVGQIQRGYSKRQTVRALLKEQKRLTVRHKFTLAGRPTVGPKDAKVVIVEFFDFECPHCKMASETVPALARKKGARLVYKQYPLQFHKAAKSAAIAAIAGHQLGKWSELQKKLFAAQDKLTNEKVAEIVSKSGVDMTKFAAAKKKAEAMVAQDMKEGDMADVDGTPSYYVNGLRVEYDDLEARVDEALKKTVGK